MIDPNSPTLELATDAHDAEGRPLGTGEEEPTAFAYTPDMEAPETIEGDDDEGPDPYALTPEQTANLRALLGADDPPPPPPPPLSAAEEASLLATYAASHPFWDRHIEGRRWAATVQRERSRAEQAEHKLTDAVRDTQGLLRLDRDEMLAVWSAVKRALAATGGRDAALESALAKIKALPVPPPPKEAR